MAKNKLKKTAVQIGTVVGKADRAAHRVAEASLLAKKELADIMKQLESLKRQLEKSSDRLKRALK